MAAFALSEITQKEIWERPGAQDSAEKNDFEMLTTELCRVAEHHGSKDDITALVVEVVEK